LTLTEAEYGCRYSLACQSNRSRKEPQLEGAVLCDFGQTRDPLRDIKHYTELADDGSTA